MTIKQVLLDFAPTNVRGSTENHVARQEPFKS